MKKYEMLEKIVNMIVERPVEDFNKYSFSQGSYIFHIYLDNSISIGNMTYILSEDLAVKINKKNDEIRKYLTRKRNNKKFQLLRKCISDLEM